MRYKSEFQAVMWRACVASLICLIAFQALYSALGAEVLSILRTTALTAFYHLAVRLVIGEWLIPRIGAGGLDCDGGWFRTRPWERKVYARLGVQRWKSGMPTYSPEEFSMERSVEEIIRSTCRAELVHECNVATSFVPLLFAIPFGALPVFLVTSVGAAAFDMIFVVMQRYNRPRLVRLMRMRERRKKGNENEQRD